ncbi:MAG: aldo/keto reductase [Actinomycetota bacterium]
MTETTVNSTLPLHAGGAIPVLGLGTWQMTGPPAYDAVRAALDLGYRHIDTATAYGNEQEIGRAVRDSDVPRADIFITTKFPPEQVGQERETLDASLRKLGVDYVDLWLVHWPPNREAAPETWREFVSAQERGVAREIGVSNYSAAQIDQLVAATDVPPALNQIPWSPRDYDAATVAEHAERDVVLEGYSAFKRSNLDDPVLHEIAAAHGVQPAQVVLRWHIDHDFVVIPKSSNRERLAANFAVWGFQLTPEEIERIDGLAG